MTTSRRFPGGGAGIALCILLCIIGLSAWVNRQRNPYNDLLFNGTLWKAAHTFEDRKIRAKMAGDLLKNYFKVGMSEAQMVALLGPPEDEKDVEGRDVLVSPPLDSKALLKRCQYDMGPRWGDTAGQNELIRAYIDYKGQCVFVELAID